MKHTYLELILFASFVNSQPTELLEFEAVSIEISHYPNSLFDAYRNA